MGYVLIMFTHYVHACECTCESARVIKLLLIFERILSKFGGGHTADPRRLLNLCVNACPHSVHQYTLANRRAILTTSIYITVILFRLSGL
jgi:hypothetical protein